MTDKESGWYWKLLANGLATMSAIAFCDHHTLAQITPDGTLGAEGSVIIPNVTINNLPAELIEGGATRGANLFHSFSEFNVGDMQRVYFANPTGIETIFSRVTGDTSSNILGTLGVNGGANLFLLNPNGIIFGQNAQLDVRGSFVASTANRFIFPDGSEFSATNPQTPPLLTINVPIGLQYGTQPPPEIRNEGNLGVGGDLTLSGGTIISTGEISAPEGEVKIEGVSGNVQVRNVIAETATLSAYGNLNLEESQLWTTGNLTLLAGDTVRVRDSATNPFIAAAGGDLLIQGDRAVDVLALNHIDSGFFSLGNMILRSSESVGGDAHYWTGGHFRVEQFDGSLGSLFSLYDPIIRSQGDVEFDGYQGTSLHILAGGQVTINTVIITGPETGTEGVDFLIETVQLSDGTNKQINGREQATLDVRAGMNLAAIGQPFGISGYDGLPNFPIVDSFFNTFGLIVPPPNPNPIATSADITINDVRIEPPDGVVLLTNQYQPNLSLPGGDIIITKNPMGSFLGFGIDGFGFGGNGSCVILDSRRHITLDQASSIITSSDIGNGGDIMLLAQENINLNPGSTLESVGSLGGNITLNSFNSIIDINDAVVASLSTNTDAGIAGDINLAAESIQVTNFGLVGTGGISGQGKGGNLNVNASNLLEITDFGGVTVTTPVHPLVQLFKQAAGGTGLATTTAGTSHAGDVTINSSRLSIRNQSMLDNLTGVATFNLAGSSGNSGNLTINASDSVEIIGNQPGEFTTDFGDAIADDFIAIPTGITSATNGSGEAGNLTINTGTLTLQEGAGISTGTTRNSTGNGGILTVNATESVRLRGFAGLGTGTVASGNAGDLIVNVPTGELILQNGAGLAADTLGAGNAGNLTVNADNISVENGSRIGSSTTADGVGATITINANNLAVAGTSTDGTVPSGIFTNSTGNGDAGNFEIDAKRVVVQDGGRVSASTSGTGNAGNLILRNANSVEVIGTATNGQIYSRLSFDTSGSGNAGNLTIDTETLAVEAGGEVSASTSDFGNAGTLNVNASDSVEVTGIAADSRTPSRLFFDSSGIGDAGILTVNTNRLLVSDGGQVSAATSGAGRGGILDINAEESVQVSGISGNFASSLFFDSRGTGDARGISMTTGQFNVENGGQVTVSGSSSGAAGDLDITANTILINNQAKLQATNTSGSGNIRINTQGLTVQNGSEITASGTGTGVSGNVEITADSIFLNNQGNLLVTTQSGEGGNIVIDADDTLLLRYNSNILTEALGTGNGGNIIISAGNFVMAILPENSDIAATAIQGRGGNIFVTAVGIFGFSLPERLVRTPESDLSAASELGINGTMEINTRDNIRLNTLPSEFLGNGISQVCSSIGGARIQNKFIVTGSGGLAVHADVPLSSDTVNVGLVSPVSTTENSPEISANITPTGNPHNSVSKPIVEAQGWIVHPDGTVELVAQAPIVRPQTPWLPTASYCP
jgi:filamentous hemagglutinin family protein